MTMTTYNETTPCTFGNVTRVAEIDEVFIFTIDIAVTCADGSAQTIRVSVENPIEDHPIDIIDATFLDPVDGEQNGDALAHVAFQAETVRAIIAAALAKIG